VEISFAHRKLARLCTDPSFARRQLGPRCAERLDLRMAYLRAARNLGQFRGVPGRPHQLQGDRARQFSLDLVFPLRLLFVADGDERTWLRRDGGIDLDAVTAIRIVDIVDTHPSVQHGLRRGKFGS
jgi:hypothetical protein